MNKGTWNHIRTCQCYKTQDTECSIWRNQDGWLQNPPSSDLWCRLLKHRYFCIVAVQWLCMAKSSDRLFKKIILPFLCTYLLHSLPILYHICPGCYDPARLCPSGIGLSFLEWSGLVQVVRDPRSAHLFVRPTFHVVYVTSVKAWHTSFFYILVLVITSLLYVQFHPTLLFYF